MAAGSRRLTLILPHTDNRLWARKPEKWVQIEKVLNVNEFGSFEILKNTIMSYNQHNVSAWSFNGLKIYLTNILNQEEAEHHLKVLIPWIAKLALRVDKLFPHPIRMELLPSGANGQVILSREQVACLLANAFFCTLPVQGSEWGDFRQLSFDKIFGIQDGGQKLKCVFHYFERIKEKAPRGLLIIQRKVYNSFPMWGQTKKLFMCNKVTVNQFGTIEDSGPGKIHMDFASKWIGGGVLHMGCVQEEIRFLICPELMVAILFCGATQDNEVILIKGAERFSLYSGYSHTFKWTKDYIDTAVIDPQTGALNNIIVAMDARKYRGRIQAQYAPEEIQRETNKAYAAFSIEKDYDTVVTGNWGCGVYEGDVQLKSIIQLIAAAVAEKNVIYYTFGDENFAVKLKTMHERISNGLWTTGGIYGLVFDYYKTHSRPQDRRTLSLFDYIWQNM